MEELEQLYSQTLELEKKRCKSNEEAVKYERQVWRKSLEYPYSREC